MVKWVYIFLQQKTGVIYLQSSRGRYKLLLHELVIRLQERV